MQNKLNNIQALRAFAVLLVVGLHLLAVEVKYSQYDVLLPNFLRIGISGVDLFFVISGFIMVAVTVDYPHASFAQRRLSAARFLWLRVTRIFPVYWLVTAFVLGIFLIHPSFLNLQLFTWQFVVKSFLLIPQQSLPLVMVGWSLVHEMYFYFVFTILLLLPRRYLPFLLLVWLCIVAEGFRHVDYYNPEQNPFTRLAFSPVTVEFIAGCFLALWFERGSAPASSFQFARAALFAGLVSLLVLWHYFSFDAQTIDVVGWTRVYLFTVPYVLMLYGVVALEKNHAVPAPQWAIQIGDHSYSIYLTHVLVLSLCGRLWKTFAWHGYLDNIVILTAAVAMVLWFGKIMFETVEMPLLRLTRRWVTRHV